MEYAKFNHFSELWPAGELENTNLEILYGCVTGCKEVLNITLSFHFNVFFFVLNREKYSKETINFGFSR